MLRRETKAETRLGWLRRSRGGGRTVGMTVIGTVAVSSAMAIRRTVIETMRDDRDTPTWIVSPIILGMMAEWAVAGLAATQWGRRRRNVPMATCGCLYGVDPEQCAALRRPALSVREGLAGQ